MDAAFFQRGDVCACSPRGAAATRSRSATGAGCPLKQLAAARRHWQPVAPGRHRLRAPSWSSRSGDLRLRVVMLYRKHVAPREPQELPARSVHPRRRALRVLPPSPPTCPWACRPCAPSSAAAARRRRPSPSSRASSPSMSSRRATTRANSAWQQLSILAHNLIRSFQLDTLAEPEAPLPQAHLRLPLPQHAHAALPPHRPGRAPDPHRRPQRPAPRRRTRPRRRSMRQIARHAWRLTQPLFQHPATGTVSAS